MTTRTDATSAARRPIVLLVLGAAVGALLAAAGLSAPATETLPPDAVAMVNGVAIRQEDFARSLEALAADTRAPLDAADRQRVLDRLIEEELLVQRGLLLDLPRHDRRVRADLTRTVIDGVVSEVDDREPDEATLRRFHAEHADFFAGPGRLRLRQVFVRALPGDAPEAQARATEAVQRLRAGEAFETVRDALGDPPPVPVPDALLPPTKLRDYLGPTALRTALELAPGEFSDPVRSASGFHVLQVLEQQPDIAPPFEEVRAEVLVEYRRRAGEQALRTYLDELRAGADVRIRTPLP